MTIQNITVELSGWSWELDELSTGLIDTNFEIQS